MVHNWGNWKDSQEKNVNTPHELKEPLWVEDDNYHLEYWLTWAIVVFVISLLMYIVYIIIPI